MSAKYKNIESIPDHIFSNKECTKTPSPELREYLAYMLDRHPDDLKYLFDYTQQFHKFGGCYQMTWVRWLNKLKRDLKEQQEQ